MLLSFLMKVEEGRRLSHLSSHSKPDTFKEWYAENTVGFWLLFNISITCIFLVTYVILVTRTPAKKTCYVTLFYCYDEKTITMEHEKGKVFIPKFPSREGYQFVGWYTDAARTDLYKNSIIKDDFALYAKWEKEA